MNILNHEINHNALMRHCDTHAQHLCTIHISLKSCATSTGTVFQKTSSTCKSEACCAYTCNTASLAIWPTNLNPTQRLAVEFVHTCSSSEKVEAPRQAVDPLCQPLDFQIALALCLAVDHDSSRVKENAERLLVPSVDGPGKESLPSTNLLNTTQCTIQLAWYAEQVQSIS